MQEAGPVDAGAPGESAQHGGRVDRPGGKGGGQGKAEYEEYEVSTQSPWKPCERLSAAAEVRRIRQAATAPIRRRPSRTVTTSQPRCSAAVIEESRSCGVQPIQVGLGATSWVNRMSQPLHRVVSSMRLVILAASIA